MEDDELPWNWDPTPANDYLNFLSIDIDQRTLLFEGRTDRDKMVVVQGNKALENNLYHCWTIHVSSISDAQLMIGVATQNADFSDRWNHRCHLGQDEHSWAISSTGVICHNNIALQHENYRIHQNDKVTVHLDMINRTLMFAINNKWIGYQYIDLPHDVNRYPVIGVTRSCEIKLVSTYTSHPSLQLLALAAYILLHCKTRSLQLERKRPLKVPEGSSFLWYGLVPVYGLILPPGLRSRYETLYPMFVVNYHSPCKSNFQSSSPSHYSKKYRVPKILKLADPFESPKPIKRPSPLKLERIVRRPKCFCKEENCSHVQLFRFTRRRNRYYVSSSDDEIFPEIAKRRKKGKCKKLRR